MAALSYFEDVFEESCFYDDEFDVDVPHKERKTIKDVMTVTMAMKCGKSSKNHKLFVRRYQGDSQQKDSNRKMEDRGLSKIIRRR
jgi:hypothetical protein